MAMRGHTITKCIYFNLMEVIISLMITVKLTTGIHNWNQKNDNTYTKTCLPHWEDKKKAKGIIAIKSEIKLWQSYPAAYIGLTFISFKDLFMYYNLYARLYSQLIKVGCQPKENSDSWVSPATKTINVNLCNSMHKSRYFYYSYNAE